MHRTGEVIYVTTANGRTYRLENCLNHHQRLRRIDEERDEMTLRRLWWRRYVKYRDDPNSKAARADYGDGGRMVDYTIDAIDGKFKPKPLPPWSVSFGKRWYFRCAIAKNNCKRIASKLMLVHWWRIGFFVASVWKYGTKDREKTMEDFGISERTYYWRIEKYASILHFS